MKKTKIGLLLISMLSIIACSTLKKSPSSTVDSSPITSMPSIASAPSPLLVVKPTDGIYAPGNEELIAIQTQYKDVTLEKLKEGYAIYTQGACINCHSALNIYEYSDPYWKDIIDDMAQRAEISIMQKDAVYKYVLSIKAANAK